MKYLNKEINGITLSRIGLGAMRMAALSFLPNSQPEPVVRNSMYWRVYLSGITE